MKWFSLLIFFSSHQLSNCFKNIGKINKKFYSPILKSLGDDVLELCEENAIVIVQEVRDELGTIFGYDPKSREVGITGQIDFVDLDGGVINVSLSGRFWHATDTVMLRVQSYIKQRIPECLDVVLDMRASSIQDDNRLNTEPGSKKLF